MNIVFLYTHLFNIEIKNAYHHVQRAKHFYLIAWNCLSFGICQMEVLLNSRMFFKIFSSFNKNQIPWMEKETTEPDLHFISFMWAYILFLWETWYIFVSWDLRWNCEMSILPKEIPFDVPFSAIFVSQATHFSCSVHFSNKAPKLDAKSTELEQYKTVKQVCWHFLHDIEKNYSEPIYATSYQLNLINTCMCKSIHKKKEWFFLREFPIYIHLDVHYSLHCIDILLR